jgi:hypothetical protein
MNECTTAQQPGHLGSPVELDSDIALGRPAHKNVYSHRPTYWYNPLIGDLVLPNGSTMALSTSTPLEAVLDDIERRAYDGRKSSATLYLVSGRNNDKRPDKKWFATTHGWHNDLYWKSLTGDYTHEDFTIYLRGTGNFFDDELRDTNGLYTAFNSLEAELENLFNATGCKVLGWTPAQTGRELLLYSLPKGVEYPLLARYLQELLHHNMYQNRIETLSPKTEVLDNGVYVIDGVWFYAGCISHLPVGPVYHDNQNELLVVRRKSDGKYAAHIPGFYNVDITVPDNWHHIGLAKENTVSDTGEAHYPNEPGYTFSNWVSAAEAALMYDNGWHIHINERIIWPDTDRITDPLAPLREKLVNFRATSTNEYHKNAIRSILLHTIGSFNSIGVIKEQFTPYDGLPLREEPYKGEYRHTQGGIEWYALVPFDSPKRLKFVHPEWSATVWGRARAKLAEFALKLPFNDVVALRADAIWSASKLESGDTSKPGSFREKAHIPGPWSWPKSGAELRRFIVKYRLEEDTEDGEENS